MMIWFCVEGRLRGLAGQHGEGKGGISLGAHIGGCSICEARSSISTICSNALDLPGSAASWRDGVGRHFLHPAGPSH